MGSLLLVSSCLCYFFICFLQLFLKESLHEQLEEARSAKLNRMAVVIQARVSYCTVVMVVVVYSFHSV